MEDSGQQLGLTPGLPLTNDPDSVPERIGQYEIIEELGRGGMGRVYAARQVDLGRIVALKVMAGSGMGADFELRFLREAQTAARLRHPNLVAVHDFGRADGQLYFSMDYIEGGDLARRLRGKAFAPWEAASVLRKVALALAHAHVEGVLHRDLKPSNILLDGDEPKLADFGLAAQLEVGGDLTAVSGVLGTPHYLAPEALRLGSVALTVSSDIYALGVVLFELLTGRTPFAGATHGSLMALVESTEPPSPRLLSPAVPKDLETICLKCLDREPTRRYATADALAEDLRRFLDGEPILARPLSGPARFVRWCRRRPALAAVWVLVSALALGSTGAAIAIDRTLGRAVTAEGTARERLRDARIAEARAIRRTTEQGRRGRALTALAEAYRIRPGNDIVDEMVTSLLVPDIRESDSWEMPQKLGEMDLAPDGNLAGYSERDGIGMGHSGILLYKWGQKASFAEVVPMTVPVLGQTKFTRDGRYLMVRMPDDRLKIWRVGETNPVAEITGRPGPGGAVHSTAFNDDYDFSPDSAHFALGIPKRGLTTHRLPDGRELERQTSVGLISRIQYSPDGRLLAAFDQTSNESDTVYILDATTLAEVRRIKVTDAPSSIAWSPDSLRFAIGLDGEKILIYDTSTWHQLASFHSPVREPSGLGFIGSGSLLTLRGHTTTLHLLDSATGVDEVNLEGFGPSPIGIGITDGRLTTAMIAGTMVRWDILDPVGIRYYPPPRASGYDQAFNNCCLDFSPDGRWSLCSYGRYTVLRDTRSGRILGELENTGDTGMAEATAAFTDNGHGFFRHSSDSGLRYYPLTVEADGLVSFGRPVLLMDEAGYLMTDHTVGGAELALVATNGKRVKVVRPSTNGVQVIGQAITHGAYSAALSTGGAQILVNCSGAGPEVAQQRLRVYRMADGEMLKELDDVTPGEATWSVDGRLAMTSNGQKRSVIWDTASWRPKAELSGFEGGNDSSFCISPDGRWIAAVKEAHVSFLSGADGKLKLTFVAPRSAGLPSSVRFLPDGRRLGVLWRDGRLDIVEPDAILGELQKLGATRQ